MIRQRRAAAMLVLAAALLLAFPSAAAPNIRVFIPDSALALSLPPKPEPPEILSLSAQHDVYSITFSAPVNSVSLLFGGQEEAMTLSADGLTARAPIPSLGAGQHGGFVARLDSLTILYAPGGSIRSIELSENMDRFFTGQNKTVTTVRWECTALRTAGDPYLIWHISSVTAQYPAGSYVARVVVHYQGDQTMSVIDYEITYSPAAGEYYLIRYGKADHVVSGEYTDGQVRLVNGSGRHFWDNTWYDAVTGRQSGKTGLQAFTSFDSPRVRTR